MQDLFSIVRVEGKSFDSSAISEDDRQSGNMGSKQVANTDQQSEALYHSGPDDMLRTRPQCYRLLSG